MKSYNEFQQELKSMKLANEDHFYFNNQCFYCKECVLEYSGIKNGLIIEIETELKQLSTV